MSKERREGERQAMGDEKYKTAVGAIDRSRLS